jgi:hypothetical protein
VEFRFTVPEMPETMMSCLSKGDAQKSSKYANIHTGEFCDITLNSNVFKNTMQQFLLLCLNTLLRTV